MTDGDRGIGERREVGETGRLVRPGPVSVLVDGWVDGASERNGGDVLGLRDGTFIV